MKLMTELRDCIRRGDLLAALLCVERLPDVDMRHKNGMTALHLATHYGNLYITDVLIKKGASFNTCEHSRGYTPLHMAVPALVHGQDRLTDALGCVRALLQAGASQTLCSGGESPLYKACVLRYKDLVKEMLRYDFDTDMMYTGRGDTVLHTACKWGNIEIVRDLCHRGCRIDATDHRGNTPLNIALTNRNIETSRYLANLNAPIVEYLLGEKTIRFYKNQIVGKD